MRCRNGGFQRCWLAVIGLSVVLCCPAAGQSNEEQLPPGPAKDNLVKLCVGCHEMDLVVARRHTRAEWDGVIEDMIARGARGTETELSALAEYLTKYLGKVNVNQATAKQLA